MMVIRCMSFSRSLVNIIDGILVYWSRYSTAQNKNEREKKHGLKVRDATREALMHRIVKVKCFSFDKYGRLLIDVVMPIICKLKFERTTNAVAVAHSK